jgi:hypothetical protein
MEFLPKKGSKRVKSYEPEGSVAAKKDSKDATKEGQPAAKVPRR